MKFTKILLIVLVIFSGSIWYQFYGAESYKKCPLPRIAGNENLYSQYFEDYILSIVFDKIQNGNYIDIGANSPDISSVTKFFYLKGWSGINIEPIKKKYLEFVDKRPNDVNLNIGISNINADLTFYRIFPKNNPDLDGLSTFDNEVLKKAILDGYSFESEILKVKTLNDVLKEHSLKNIHFITIDVEGLEEQVLSTINFNDYRPFVFIIEATEPRTFSPSHEKWEYILKNNNYIRVMFDGLNMYYLDKERVNELYNNFKYAHNCVEISNKKYKVIDNEALFYEFSEQ